MIFRKRLAGHLFGHQEMSECFGSYFKKSRVAVVFGSRQPIIVHFC